MRSSSESSFLIPFDLFLQLGLATEHAEGRRKVELAAHVVDVDSPALAILAGEPQQHAEGGGAGEVQEVVDRTIDLGGTSKFKKVEDFFIEWHQADGEHPSALGVYINVRLRNGDEEDMFVPPRGSLDEALNFLPEGEDMAMASRPGLYKDMSKDVFSRTAIRNTAGVMEHALRYNILNPKSKRIGDVHSIEVGRIPPLFREAAAVPVPQNGLRTLDGEYVDPIDLTNTDVTFTIDIRPSVDDDGLLVWNTDLDVSIDALFEFTTFWAFTLVTICFGPVGAAIFLGSVFVLEIGAGIFFGEYFEARASKKADATLSDVIPDRLTIKTRRWDPLRDATPGRDEAEPGRVQRQGLPLRQGVRRSWLGATRRHRDPRRDARRRRRDQRASVPLRRLRDDRGRLRPQRPGHEPP